MNWLRVPFRYWPLRWHVAPALLLVAISAAISWGVVRQSERRLALASQYLEQARKDADARQPSLAQESKGDWTERLPTSRRVDEVIRQAGRYAQAHTIQINSVSIERQPASAMEFGQSRLVLGMSGGYREFKAWLADMLDRNDTLAVQALSIRRTSDLQQDVQLTLVLFTKD